MAALESIVEHVYQRTTAALWVYLRGDADLNGVVMVLFLFFFSQVFSKKKNKKKNHLQACKDYFLLGKGDLIVEFVEQAKNILELPPTSTVTRGRFGGCGFLKIKREKNV